MPSIWYYHPLLYEFGAILLQGNRYNRMLSRVAEMIGKNKSVLDLGAGTCRLASMLDSTCTYEGWDLNQRFVSYYQRKGINVKLMDVFQYSSYPPVDCIVLLNVFHHVAPRQSVLLRQCLEHAGEKVIVCELFRNVESRPIYWRLVRLREILGLEKLIGDWDGVNREFDRYPLMSKDELRAFLDKHGRCKITELDNMSMLLVVYQVGREGGQSK